MGNIVITGANRGIGLELVRLGKTRGHVVAVCRQSSPELDALEVQVEAGIDVGKDEGAQALAQRLHGSNVDVLINNAGIMRRETLDEMDFTTIRDQFEVNSLGPLRISHALLPMMREGGRIGIITSRMGSIGDNTSGSRYGYRMSKAAVNMAGVSLALDLRNRGIAVAILHPGFVRTGMTRQNGHVDAPEAASGLWKRMDELTLTTSGTFWHANGNVLPW